MFPLNVNAVLLVPVQTEADPAIVPPTLAGLTVPETETVCVAAPVLVAVIVSVKVPAVTPVILTQILVAEIVPLVGLMISVFV